MSSYPDVKDPDFYNFVNRKYAKYKIPKDTRTLQDFCFPKKFEPQIPQKFLAEFINPNTDYRGVLVFYNIGAGKTCTAMRITENFKGKKNIMVVLPASLKGNFRSEFRSACTGEAYITEHEREQLKSYHPSDPRYKEIIRKSDERINKYYTIYSYNKFINLLQSNKLNLSNTILVIDEVHNMISETGTYYDTFYHYIQKKTPSDFRLVIMTATPIFDKPAEIALTMNLLLPKGKKLPTGTDFIHKFIRVRYTNKGPKYSVRNMKLFKKYIRGYVSYYRGAPPYTFPTAEIHYVKCKMSDTQKKLYKKILKKLAMPEPNPLEEGADISNSFYIGTRMVSNFVFPNKKVNQEGYKSLTEEDLNMQNLKELSPKFHKIIKRIKQCDGTVFVYSNFKEYGGIRTFARALEHQHFKNYQTDGPGLKRYAIWSGDQHPFFKDEVKAVFNNKDNMDGSKIKVILGSPSIKEGVSLLRVQQVHLMEPYWNMSRMDQIIGRAIRYCSHKDMPPSKRIVQVYIYLASHPEIKKSVDERIIQLALQKRKINSIFEQALKEAAIDCELFKNANVYPGEEDIICEV